MIAQFTGKTEGQHTMYVEVEGQNEKAFEKCRYGMIGRVKI